MSNVLMALCQEYVENQKENNTFSVKQKENWYEITWTNDPFNMWITIYQINNSIISAISCLDIHPQITKTEATQEQKEKLIELLQQSS